MSELAGRRSNSRPPDECDPLLQSSPSRREQGEENSGGETSAEGTHPIAGGTILGIHNLAIVMPQFIVRYIFPFILVDGISIP